MAAKAAYLEQYLDSLESLPSELQRNFTLMRDLDNRAQEVLKTIDKMSNEYLQSASNYTAEEKNAKVDHIQNLYKKVQAYSDDKVQLATQTYEMVDKHIRRLDADMGRFEADIKGKALNLHLSDSDTNNKKRIPSHLPLTEKGRKIIEKVEKKKGRHPPLSDDDAAAKSGRKKKTSVQPEIPAITTLAMAHPSDVLDMPVDPNEPTYCFCHQVSYGEMIGCDNPDCPIEWFHFACVGLISKPKGKWYCSQCSTDRKKK